MGYVGRKLRESRLLFPKSNRGLIVPIDHGLTMGPISVLQSVYAVESWINSNYVSAVLAHKGVLEKLILRGMLRPSTGIILHMSGMPSISESPDTKILVASIEAALQLGVDAVSIQVNFTETNFEHNLSIIGRPVDIVTAKIVDMASGDEVSPGSVGALAVCSPTITSGYWKQNQKTADAWRNGYFLTGDVGYCKDNVFYQIDRVVDVVHTPDGSLYTLQLEETIQTIESVYDATIIGLNFPRAENGKITLVALILLSKKLTEDVDTVAEKTLQLMQEKNGIENSIGEYIVIVVNSFDQIPIGVTGKVLKRRLRDLLPKILEEYETSKEIPNGILKITRHIPTN